MALLQPTGGITKPVIGAIMGPQSVFGWSALVEPHVITLSAATVHTSNLVLVDGANWKAFLEEPPDIGYRIMRPSARLLAERLAQTREALLYERS